MKGIKRKVALMVAVTAGFFIGTFRGETAKQRFKTKARDKYADHTEQVSDKPGEVELDEYELYAFHNG